MPILRGILLSLFIHAFLVWSAKYAPQFAPVANNENITVEILNNPSQNKTQQIVRETIVPEKLKVQESEDPLKFLSKETQRVKKQTQALLSGMTKNRANQANNKNDSEQNQNTQNRPKNLDAFTPGYRKLPDIASQQRMNAGQSTIGEAMPKEVSVGSFTALNTDRYLYYSFFSRIEELIRFRWETNVQNTIDYTPPARLGQNPKGIWVTQLQVLIDNKGEIKDIKIMKESGLKGFDQSAAQAFIQARLLPNPPKEMVEDDGLIRLDYSFQVRYSPRAFVRSRE